MKNKPYTSLSDRTKEIIFGSLLGDGSLKIQKGYAHARFSFRHSITQSDYFNWKVNELKEISGISSVWQQKPDGWSAEKKLRFQSLALPALTEISALTHKKNQLHIRRKWLNMMSPLSLAVWWFDDGSIISNGRKGVFCTDSFDKKSVKTLAQYLRVVWKIETHVAPIGRKRDGKQKQYWRLWIRSTEELKKFLRIILPYVSVASLIPKILILYRDSQLQQRWISEVETLSKFYKSEIENSLAIKKSKWKRFR